MNYYPPAYNPNYMPMQQRLTQMEQQYPQFTPNSMNTQAPQSNSAQPSMLKGRPVTGIDEAKAAPIDFDGSVHIFPDIANKRIYTKQLGMDGLPLFSVYELTPVADNSKPPNDIEYVPAIDFEELKKKVEQIEHMVSKPKSEKQSGGK